MSYIRFGVLLLFLSISTIFAADPASAIKNVNLRVASIDDSVKSGMFASLKIDEVSTSEGSPASLEMFFVEKRIILIVASVGHESWSNEFKYYYYPTGKPMKYLKTTKDRPDNPAKESMIFNEKGEILWKNVDEIIFSASELYTVFSKLQEVRMQLSK